MRNMALILAGAVASTVAGPLLEIYQHRPDALALNTSQKGLVRETERSAAGSFRDRNGMFYIDGNLSKGSIRFLIDTGASHVVLSHDAARAVRSHSTSAGEAVLATAGGPVDVDWIVIPELEVDSRVLRNVKAAVPRRDIGVSLLGQNALSQFGSVHITGDHLTLYR